MRYSTKRILLTGGAIVATAVGVVLYITISPGASSEVSSDGEERSRREPVSGVSDSGEEMSPGKYRESPILRERVERGDLPPIEERLPDEPFVVTPVERPGRYQSSPADP